MITPDGPLGFQVSATDPDHEMRLIGHFSTLAEAEAFADSMRQIDGRQSYSMGPKAIGLTAYPEVDALAWIAEQKATDEAKDRTLC